MRRVLRLPAYPPLLAAYTLNELAWSIGSVALSFLVYHRTHSAFGATAFFLCSQFAPALLAPILVARFEGAPARRVLPALYALDCLAFLALAWIASNFTLAPLLVLTAIDGLIALAARSLARATTVAVTSPAGLLRDGNAVLNGAFSVCFMVGPAVGGALVVAGGASVAMLTNSGLFALIAAMLLPASLPASVSDVASATGRVRAALAHAIGRPAIRTLLALQAAAVLFFTISIPVEVVFAQRNLHAGAGGYGGLLSAWGGGAVAGAAIYARWRGRPSRQLIALGSGLLGIGFVVMAVSPTLGMAIAGAAIAGIGNGIEAVSARTALQEVVETNWMAMMMSLNESLFQLVPGAGILLGGLLTAFANPRVAFWVAGAGSLLVTVAVWVVLRPFAVLHAVPEPDALHGAAGAAQAAESQASAAPHQ